MNIKIVLLVITSLFVTNIITYKLTYEHAEVKSFLANISVDIMRLKMYNESGMCDDQLILNIHGLYVAAVRSKNIKKFSSICRVFKKEYFDIVDELSTKYPPPILTDITEKLYEKIELGKKKMKKLCNVQCAMCKNYNKPL